MANNKKYLSILFALLLTISVAVCFTACKKEKGKSDVTTSALTPEEASILESQLEKDDNVVEDPFGPEEDTGDTTAASGNSGSSGSGSNSGSNSGNGSSGSTTKKSGNNTTTTQRTSKASQETTLPEAEDVTDENGDHWTGWY